MQHRRTRRGHALLLAALALGLSACQVKCHFGTAETSTELTTEDVERMAAAELSKMAGTSIAVDCPPLTSARLHRCTGYIDGGSPFAVSIDRDAPGHFNFEADAFVGSRAPQVLAQIFAGTTVENVQCPPVIAAGGAGSCTATIDGVSLSFRLRYEGDEVKVQEASAKMVDGPKAASMLAEILARAGTTATVECGSGTRILGPDNRLECPVHVGEIVSSAYLYIHADGDMRYNLDGLMKDLPAERARALAGVVAGEPGGMVRETAVD